MDNEPYNYRHYWNERLKGNFDLDAVGYLGLGLSFNKWMYRVRKYNFLRNVKRKIKIDTNGRILDIGSGTGFYIQLWQKLGATKLDGIDISRDAIVNLKKEYPEYFFYELDVIMEDLPNYNYQVISCMDVLFHIVEDKNLEVCIKKISKSLQKGGYFIFTDNFLQDREQRSKHHVSRSSNYLKYLVDQNEFEIILHKPVFWLMNYPIDSNNYYLKLFFTKLQYILTKYQILGDFLGAILFPIELFITRFANQGPSTEIMICEKK